MTREEAIEEIKQLIAKCVLYGHIIDDDTCGHWREVLEVLSKGEPTTEEVINYCNKRGYVICTQEAVMKDPEREKCRIHFDGYVGVDSMGRYDHYTDSFV